MENIFDLLLRLIKSGKEDEARKQFDAWADAEYKQKEFANKKLVDIYKILTTCMCDK